MAFANVQTSDTLNTLRSTTNQALSLLTAVEQGSYDLSANSVSILNNLVANTLTANVSITGNLTGDVYSTNGTKILENGTDGLDSTLKVATILDTSGGTVLTLLAGATELTIDDINADRINNALLVSASVANINVVNANTINGATLKTYDIEGEILGNVSGAVTLNLANANFFSANTTANTTWTFSTPPEANNFGGFVLALGGGGNYNQTWPTSVRWAQNTAPTLTDGTSSIDILVFVTYTGGTIWHGAASILNSPKT